MAFAFPVRFVFFFLNVCLSGSGLNRVLKKTVYRELINLGKKINLKIVNIVNSFL